MAEQGDVGRDPRLGCPITDTYEDYLHRREAAEDRPVLIEPARHRILVRWLNGLYDTMDRRVIGQSVTDLAHEAGKVERLLVL